MLFIIGSLQEHLPSDESLAHQTEVLVEQGCPMAEDPAGCEAGLNTWWAAIGEKNILLVKFRLFLLSFSYLLIY